MRIAVTGASGFLGRYVVRHLLEQGHTLRCWRRPSSDVRGLDSPAEKLQWIEGELGNAASARTLMEGCDAVVHAALWRPGASFRGGEGDVVTFAEKNVIGSLQLIESAAKQEVTSFVFISTCAVHEVILDDRPLDEAHPLWASSHYGAHKAAIEKFVHSFGLGHHMPICALRPTGIYGVAHPSSASKWFALIRDVVQGRPVSCARGGKEVHAADVAKAAHLLLSQSGENIRGQAFNCYDRYISEYEVANMANDICGNLCPVHGAETRPKHQIETGKLRSLGMTFGGTPLLQQTVRQLVELARQS